MKKTKPGAPHLPKLLRLSVPVRQAHIEDIYGEYPVEQRDALCSRVQEDAIVRVHHRE